MRKPLSASRTAPTTSVPGTWWIKHQIVVKSTYLFVPARIRLLFGHSLTGAQVAGLDLKVDGTTMTAAQPLTNAVLLYPDNISQPPYSC